MKKIYTLFAALLFTSSIYAQAPQKMSYQAVIRNAANALVTNHSIGMKISILQGATPVYVETQTASTNANGLVSLEIGGGTLVSGNFSTINWASGTYFVKTETDPAGGTNYTITGSNQILSVPYALNSGDNKWTSNVNGINNKSGNVGIGTATPSSKLTVVSSSSNDVVEFDGANQMFLTLSENGIHRGYIGSFTGNPEDVDFGTYAGSLGAVHLTTKNLSRLTVINNGNVGIGTTSPTTKVEVNGFSKLGTDAPAVKMKKLTGITSATEGGTTSIAHGVDGSKILAINVLVQYASVGYGIPSSYNANPGYEFIYYVTPTAVIVWTKTGNSSIILSKPIKILISYEE